MDNPNGPGETVPKHEDDETLIRGLNRLNINSVIKPKSFKKGENFNAFCDRFLQYVEVTKLTDQALYINFLSLLDDRTYQLSQCWQARPWTFIFYIIFILTHQKSFNWFNLSSKYSNSMENITGKRSDPVRKIINIAQKTRQHCYTKLGKVTQKCHIQVPKKPC